MTQIIHSSKFLQLSYEQNTQTLVVLWLTTSSEMSEDNFKTEIHVITNAVRQTKAIFVLGLTKEMRYTIVPALQEWHNGVLFPAFAEVGVKKLAVVVSNDIFALMSIEQLIEDVADAKFITRYFDEELVARDWLMMS
jgi:hypothetical protein